MHWIRNRIVIAGLMAVLATGLSAVPASQVVAEQYYAAADESRRGFNDEYIFATTRSVSNMDANPALKLTLFPLTIVLDTVLLPFAVIAGFVT